MSLTSAYAAKATKDDIVTANNWTKSHLQSAAVSAIPFSFEYNGKKSSELLSEWKVNRTSRSLDKVRKQETIVWTDPETSLEVRCVAVEYTDYPTVEWTLYFKNNGNADTPILSNILALNTKLNWESDGNVKLHHFMGAPATPVDYHPFLTELKATEKKRLSASAGLGTNNDLPYFNMEWPGGGAIVAVGWPGQWTCDLARDSANGISLKAGQELTHFKLHPGEQARTPLMVLQFYTGNWMYGQNIWRAWMLDHSMPRPGGKLPNVEMAACSSHQYGEMINANTENQEMFIDRYLDEKLPLDFWWMDAGWYVNESGWPNTGTWEVDEKRFPGGLKPITDHAHAKKVKTIVWFEPERVTPGTWLYQHSDWLLTNPDDPNGQKLLNMGNPEARKWLTNHISKMITDQGIDLYRQDYNIGPLGFWRAADTEDRQGMTENLYVQGYLAYWDALRKDHPNMLIDSCASGGRRNDLETLRRAVPLLRSDYLMEPTSQQCHTYGIAFWYPFYGTGSSSPDIYQLRSLFCPHFTGCFDMRRTDLDYNSIRKVLNEWKYELAPNFFGDYYPLTDYSAEKNAWMAFEWNSPNKGKGAIQAFRREEAGDESMTLKLYGLDSNAKYSVKDVDSGDMGQFTGKDLMDKGLTVTLKAKPSSAVILYTKVK